MHGFIIFRETWISDMLILDYEEETKQIVGSTHHVLESRLDSCSMFWLSFLVLSPPCVAPAAGSCCDFGGCSGLSAGG